MENTYCNNIDCCNIDLITLYYIYLTQKTRVTLTLTFRLKNFQHSYRERKTDI